MHEAVRLALLKPHRLRELLRNIGGHLVTPAPGALDTADGLDVSGAAPAISHLDPEHVTIREWSAGLRLDSLGNSHTDARAVVDNAQEECP